MLPGYEDREVSDRVGERPLPDDVFHYGNPASWRNQIWALLADVVTPGVKASFLDDPPEYLVCDDLEWLDGFIEEETGSDSDIKKTLASRLTTRYRAFRAMHATRTNNLAQFYERGICMPLNAEIEDVARGLFLNGRYKSLDERSLNRAIADLNDRDGPYRSDDQLRNYLCADERAFTTRVGGSGHYADFGSEYLFNLAIRLVGEHEAKRVLRSVGSPCILIADIPMSLLGHYTISSFSGLVLEFLFSELLGRPEESSLGSGLGSAIILRHAIPAEALVGHFHPAVLHHSHR